jgi:hypothetical protein
VDRDRTIHVTERILIANENGFFDGGVHRQLRIKPASAERGKASSFDSLTVAIDVQSGTVELGQVGDKLDVRIATNTRGLSRGSHLIEVTYTGKHQFEVYGYFEDFNQDITGEWPLPIEKVSVEVHFPEGLPAESGFSADTGLSGGSDSKFDCVRRDLPSGVRFETTHALPPQNRLLFSSRFTKKGYFLSNASEDGYWAVVQDHPYVIPALVALAGLIISLAIGVFVWRRAPSSSQSTTETLGNFGRRFRREVAATYGFAIVMFALAIVPMRILHIQGMGDRVGSWRRSVFHGRSSECCTSSEWARPSLALGTRAFAG